MDKVLGIVLTLGITLVAIFTSSFIPVGSVALAIIIGAILGNSVKLSSKFNAGITYSEKTLLAVAISLMGIHLDFNVLTQLGFNTITLIIFSLITTIIFTFVIAKRMKFEKNFALILGIGNGICGSAAIAATKDIVKLDKEKSALAVAIVNLLGTLGLFLIPIIGLLLGFSDVQIGIFIGNTLQSVGHVVASGFGVNETVGQSATIVKMGRILLLTPVILWLIYFVAKQNSNESENSKKLQVPIFVIGFIFFSIIATLNILPQNIEDMIAWLCKMTLLLAMSAIGLKISFKAIKQNGWEAFKIAGIIFKFQILLSMVLITIL